MYVYQQETCSKICRDDFSSFGRITRWLPQHMIYMWPQELNTYVLSITQASRSLDMVMVCICTIADLTGDPAIPYAIRIENMILRSTFYRTTGILQLAHISHLCNIHELLLIDICIYTNIVLIDKIQSPVIEITMHLTEVTPDNCTVISSERNLDGIDRVTHAAATGVSIALRLYQTKWYF